MCADRSFARRFASVSSFRRALLTAGACLAVTLAAASAHAATQTLTVTTLNDDASPAACSGTSCTTLRDAIAQANTDTNDTITFASGLSGTLTLSSALPTITASMTITGPTTGAGITISGDGKYTVLTINSGTVSISNLTIEDGFGSNGGGVLANGSASLTVTDSTFLRNTVGLNAGAISAAAGTLTVVNSTFVGNTAGTGNGGAIELSDGTATVVNDTFSANTAGSGDAIYVGTGTLTVENTILSDSGVAASECTGSSCPTTGTDGNYIGTGAMLLPLGNYGGTTPTMLPLPGSAAIGVGIVGDVSGLANSKDQRGFPITSTVDAGAVQTNYLKPTSLASTYSANADLDLSGLSSPPTSTAITISGGAVNLIGPGADKLTVTGDGSSSVFTVDSGAQAVFYGMTISGGGGTTGGGINNEGTATILDSVVSGNSTGSSSTVGSGGGIYSNTGVLTIIGSTVSNNTAVNTGVGGGIFNYAGPLTMINSTVSKNTSAGTGGGISNAGNATAVLTNVTVSGNTGASGGGISNAATLTLNNSIVEQNTATTDPDIDPEAGTVTDGGGNVINQTASATTVNLAGLGNYGGPTQTMLPIPGSGLVAICAGEKSLAVDQYGLPLTTDQRGAVVGASTYCASGTGAGTMDAGAVQTDYTAVAFTNANSTFGYEGLVNSPVNRPAAPIVQVTENGQSVGGVPVSLVYTGTSGSAAFSASALTATTAAGTATTPSAGATFGSLTSTAAGSGALSATLQLTATKTLTSSTSPDLAIDPVLVLATASLTSATVAMSSAYGYDFTTNTSGGASPYTYAVTTGSLPTGMTLAADGTLSGSPVAAGSTPFTVTVTDADGNTTTQNYTLTVGQATTIITMSSSGTPALPNTSVTFTATLSPTTTNTTSADFSGTVSFYSNGVAIPSCSADGVTVSGGTAQATCTLSSGLAAGSYNITATYSGDASYSAVPLGGAPTFVQNVSLASASVAVTASPSAVVVDQPETFTATVTGNSTGKAPGGAVTFTIGATTLCSGTLGPPSGNTATASCTSSALEVGDSGLTITATYAGDGKKYGSSTGTVAGPTVSAAVTSVKVTSSGAVGVNQQATLTATITPLGPVALSSTGTVTFSDGAGTISGCTGVTITPSTGIATCTASFGTAATQTISAVYNGDANYAATTTGNVTTLTQVVNKATTAVAISSSSSTSNVDDSVTFTADVTPQFTGITTPGGSVTFTANGATLCGGVAVVLVGNNYQATCTVSTLSAGSQAVVATYTGDSNYNGGTNNMTQTVNAIASGITLNVSPGATTTVNQSVTFTADVTPIGKTLPLTGSVSFTDNTNPMSCAVGFDKTTGVATCTVANLPLGANTIAATYAGDTNYTTSNTSIAQTVGQGATSTAVAASPGSPSVNQSVTLTATVAEATPGAAQLSGNVSFTSNGAAISGCSTVAVNPNTAQATCATSALPLGADTVAATYANDTNFSGSTGQLSVTVVPASTNLVLVSSAAGNASTVNQTVAFTATVSGASGISQFTGRMSFTEDGSAIAGCSSLPVNATTGVAVCATTALPAGTQAIAASYAGDPNFAASTASLTENVTAASSSTTLVSSPNPSVVENPKNSGDVVNLTATVSPSNGGVPLSGTVAFTANGVAIGGCTAIPVNASTGLATCSSMFSTFGTQSIVAVYGHDPNYASSQGAVTQQVQDYALSISPTTSISVAQGFTNANDPFTAQVVGVSASSFGGFTGSLALTCTVAAVATAQGAVLPTCSLGAATLAVASGASSQPIAVTINTGSGANLASPGTYSVFVTGVDAATGLTHATSSLTVNVRYVAPALTLASGATSGNTGTLNFVLPSGVGITSFQCTTVTGPTLSVSINPSGLGMGCAFNPSSIAAVGSTQTVSTTLTLSTNIPLSQARVNHDAGFGGGSAVEVAGVIGVPIFMLLGFMPGVRRTRKVFFRYLGVVLVAVLLFGGINGCGGGSFTAPATVSGTTPPGTYNVLVQGAGTDGHTYEAVVTVNVTR